MKTPKISSKTQESWIQRPHRFVIAAFGVSWLLMPFLEQSFSYMSKVAIRFRGQSLSQPNSEWAHSVYEVVSSVPALDFVVSEKRIELNRDVVEQFRPFRQLHAFAPDARLILLASIVLTLSLIVIGRFTSGRVPLVSSRLLPLSNLLTAGCIAMAVATRSAHSGWDEVYVFASQAENFANRWIPAVSVTGQKGFAESSADSLSPMVAGLIKKLFEALNIETCLVVGNIFLALGLALVAVHLLRKWWGLSATTTSVILGGLILLPPHLMTLSAGSPVVVANLGFTLLVLLGLRGFQTGDFRSLGVWTVLLGLVRWEYGPIAVLVMCLGLITTKNKSWKFNYRPVVIASSIQLLIGSIRWIMFGYPIPSAVIFKSVGLDPVYIAGGLDYLKQASVYSGWTGITVFVILVVWLHRSHSQIKTVMIIVCLIPLVIAPLAGGDWFPAEWARYAMPSVTALAVLGCLSLFSPRTPRSFLKTVLLIGIYLGSLIALNPVGRSLLVQQVAEPERHEVLRLECLARAGQTVGAFLPDKSGIASPEVNTLAFFAKQPLTDLSGLVDFRIASVPPSPLAPGDLMHRKSNPQIINTDNPGAIYLWEGAHCQTYFPSSSDYKAEWKSLLEMEISRFRAGSTDELLNIYSPVTLINNYGDVVHVLIRKDLIGKE